MWELAGQKFDSEEADISFKNGVATLILEDAMPEDSGEYKCVASNSAGKAVCSCHVTVHGKKRPTIRFLSSSESAMIHRPHVIPFKLESC